MLCTLYHLHGNKPLPSAEKDRRKRKKSIMHVWFWHIIVLCYSKLQSSYWMSQASHTVEKCPHPSFRITWYLPLNRSPIFTWWYPPNPRRTAILQFAYGQLIDCPLGLSLIVILLGTDFEQSMYSMFRPKIEIRIWSDYWHFKSKVNNKAKKIYIIKWIIITSLPFYIKYKTKIKKITDIWNIQRWHSCIYSTKYPFLCSLQ